MAFTRVTDLVDQMVAENANQYAKTLEGDAGAGRPITLTALSDAVNYALSVANQDGANGRALQVYKADLVNKWLDITKAASCSTASRASRRRASPRPGRQGGALSEVGRPLVPPGRGRRRRDRDPRRRPVRGGRGPPLRLGGRGGGDPDARDQRLRPARRGDGPDLRPRPAQEPDHQRRVPRLAARHLGADDGRQRLRSRPLAGPDRDDRDRLHDQQGDLRPPGRRLARRRQAGDRRRTTPRTASGRSSKAPTSGTFAGRPSASSSR
jgi:hypothetical protein